MLAEVPRWGKKEFWLRADTADNAQLWEQHIWKVKQEHGRAGGPDVFILPDRRGSKKSVPFKDVVIGAAAQSLSEVCTLLILYEDQNGIQNVDAHCTRLYKNNFVHDDCTDGHASILKAHDKEAMPIYIYKIIYMCNFSLSRRTSALLRVFIARRQTRRSPRALFSSLVP